MIDDDGRNELQVSSHVKTDSKFKLLKFSPDKLEVLLAPIHSINPILIPNNRLTLGTKTRHSLNYYCATLISIRGYKAFNMKKVQIIIAKIE